MEQALVDAALARGGVFAHRHVVRAGVPPASLHRAVSRGQAIRVRRDAFVLGSVWSSASPDQRLLLRTKAVLLSLGRAYAASHVASLALHGLPLWGVDRTVVDVAGPGSRTRLRSGVRRHPTGDRALHTVEGWRGVEAATALCDVVCTTGLVPAVVAGDGALRSGVVTRESLAAAVEAYAERRSVTSATRPGTLLHALDGAAESAGESRLRLLLTHLGFVPRSQVTITDAGTFVARVDFLVGDRVVVEFDGLVKYAGADGRLALAREKAREEQLTALGYVVIRFVWADLDHPDRILRRLAQAMTRARRYDAGGRTSAR